MDTINKPAHYNQGPIECIDAMQIVLTPEEFRGFLKGNVFKYLWREKGKNGIEDLRKGKDYYDRLIEHCDLQESLLDISNGLVKAWTCENGKAKQVYPEQPKTPLNSDKIPEGYRKLNDSSEEPRQLGDLRWSVSEKRYIEIGVDEIGYANRDNWAACRKIEPVIKQSLITEPDPGEGYRLLGKNPPEKLLDTDEGLFAYGLDGQKWLPVYYSCGEQLPSVYYRRKIDVATLKQSPQLPDGWRWLEVGEAIRKGDKYRDLKSETWIECVVSVGDTLQDFHKPTIRRNKFEVGEKVVRVSEPRGIVFQVKCAFLDNSYGLATEGGMVDRLHAKDLAPYIEDAK